MKSKKENSIVEEFIQKMYAAEYYHNFYDEDITPEDDIKGYAKSIAEFEGLKKNCLGKASQELLKGHFKVSFKLWRLRKCIDAEIKYAENKQLHVRDYYQGKFFKKQNVTKTESRRIAPTIAPSTESLKTKHLVRTKKR